MKTEAKRERREKEKEKKEKQAQKKELKHTETNLGASLQLNLASWKKIDKLIFWQKLQENELGASGLYR